MRCRRFATIIGCDSATICPVMQNVSTLPPIMGTKDQYILVVDDDREDHLILQEYFNDISIVDQVQYEVDGRQALDYLQHAAGEGSLPKLIVLDLNMPIVSGLEVLAALKNHDNLQTIPVIIYTTSKNEKERSACMDLGAVDYIVKPVTTQESKRAVAKFASYLGA